MNIVILDAYCANPGDLSWDPLEKLGNLTIYDRTPYDDEEIVRRAEAADILITNKTPIRRSVIDRCPRLKYITVLATGFNIVDYDYAWEKGIAVSNVPAYSTESVVQHTLALLFEICHHVGSHSQGVFEGRWTACKDFSYWDYPVIELSGKTMGIIGFGRIGKRLAAVAGALGMKVLAVSPHENEEGRALAEYTDINTLLASSDVISLHCPLTAATEELINSKTIARMKDGVILLNTGRGQLINEADVAGALKSGKIAAAGMDVVTREPIAGDNPLLTAPNCFITPHIAWTSAEARARIMECTEENITAFQAGKPVNVVNNKR